MKHLKTLVLMQFKNKVDFGWVAEKKSVIRTVVFSVLKFLILTAVVYVVLYLLKLLGIFYYSEAPKIMILMMFISLVLSLLSCTAGLMKSLFISEDNKVLITFPVSGNYIFVSKVIVYFIYELKRSFSFIIPIVLACVVLLFGDGLCSFWVFIWMWIPLLLIIALPVLIGALLAIPLMYVYSFFRKHSLAELILAIAVLVGLVYVVVTLINLIPENINLIEQWNGISKGIRDFLVAVETRLSVISQLVYLIVGEKQIDITYAINFVSVLKLVIFIAIIAILSILVFFISKPIFFKTMVKSGDSSKDNNMLKKNTRHNRYISFVNKEWKINLRTIEISVNYLLIYIIVPISILLVNSIYKAIDTKQIGDLLIYSSNILLICLPLLASNGLVATYYSREGHTGYLKKTKPIFAAYPLLAKLVFNVVFSIPSVFITVWIFGSSCGFAVYDIVFLGFAILFLHIGHMLWSATLDIMNPQNEQYQTSSGSVSNPNEDKSTMLAFIISIIYALISYLLFSESTHQATIKLLLISILFLVSIASLMIMRIKAYYYEK